MSALETVIVYTRKPAELASFTGGAFLFDMSGEIDAHRVSPYVDP